MTKRKIIEIDEDKCNGCRLCIPTCHEGALQMIDGKARLISDLFCDGLGACIGHCPQGAIKIIEREAKQYDEVEVMAKNIVPKGQNTIKAHLEHLLEHNEARYLKEATDYLKRNNIKNPLEKEDIIEEEHMNHKHSQGGCPGSKMMQFKEDSLDEGQGMRQSQLRQWPIQLHLVSPQAPYYRNADVIIAADCTAFSLGDFHKDYLKGKALAIACPKLDSEMEIYVDKIQSMIDDSKINTLTVIMMQVPCCGGLLSIAQQAASQAKRKIPIKAVIVGIQGQILSEEWA
jgi:NAD-dependent dihydropyrimidine dehydrogenase PreA subunit